MDMWNEPLTRENVVDFYNSTIFMAYSSVLEITKEPTRAEQAIIKSYTDVYQQRSSINGEDVIYVFGDILLKNTNEIVEKSPPPENIDFSSRTLDEYTRNYMLEKINSKIDSTSYKFAEFISSDYKKGKSSKSSQRIFDLLPVTPLLVFILIFVALIIWIVSYGAVTLPYKDKPLVNADNLYHSDSLQEEYVNILQYYPLNVDFPVSDAVVDSPEQGNVDTNETSSDSPLAPVIGTTEASATRG